MVKGLVQGALVIFLSSCVRFITIPIPVKVDVDFPEGETEQCVTVHKTPTGLPPDALLVCSERGEVLYCLDLADFKTRVGF